MTTIECTSQDNPGDFYYNIDLPPDSTDENVELIYTEDDVVNTKATKWD